MKLGIVRRNVKDNGERILLTILLLILIIYFAKEVYLEDIQIKLLNLKYHIRYEWVYFGSLRGKLADFKSNSRNQIEI